MKNIFLLLLLMCQASLAMAQSKLDLQSQMRLSNLRMEQKQLKAGGVRRMPSMNNSMNTMPVGYTLGIVKMADNATESDLLQEGVNVIRSRHGFAFVTMPLEDVERVAQLNCVKRMQLAMPVRQSMNHARQASKVDLIHQGIGLPQAYTGKGVICAIVDQGMDPNHINFSDAEGNPRVKYLSNFSVNDYGEIQLSYFNTPELIRSYTTDSYDNYHGTHTMGIMAGGYKGPVTLAEAGLNGTATVKTVDECPFYGVAYDADIIASGGVLYDAIIAMGVDDLLNCIYYEKKPAVINISIGKNVGPHDGTSMLCQFFDSCAVKDNAIICLSAGNEGDQKIAAHKLCTAEDNELKCFINGYDYTEEEGNFYWRYGATTIYSDTDQTFDIQMVLYNKRRGVVARSYVMTVDASHMGTTQRWLSDEYFRQTETDVIDPIFGKYISGYIAVGIDYDTESKRFYATVDCNAIDNPETNGDHNYAIGFIAKGSEGQKLYAYNDYLGSFLSSNETAGWDDGNADGSISDIATGKYTIAVGSYNVSKQWAALDGIVYKPAYSDLEEGGISPFSSYGTLVDGRNLPHICAPGAIITSSANHYCEVNNILMPSAILGRVDDSRKDIYAWQSGTSMASPYVAGTIALWLEADPTLTVADVKDIIAATAFKDEMTVKANPVQAGAGKFDAYAGLKEVLNRSTSGINDLHSDSQTPVMTAAGHRQIRLFMAGAQKLHVAVYNMNGLCMYNSQSNGDETIVDLSRLAKGAYIISANGKQQKIVIAE